MLLALHDASGTIYSSTDGSVKGIHKTDVSSTWGLCIRVQAQDGTITRITRHGKILITAGEESSYRVEVEGLIQIYTLLPATFHTTHACDNEAAVDAHDTIDYHARKGARKWATTDYRTALDRLLQAINRRGGTKLDVVHTHSHLEHQHTDDTALRIRRDTLAEADTQADSGHTLPGTLCTPSLRELFTVHSHRGPLEKNVGAATLTHMVQQKKTQLASLPMEGALLKHMHDSIPTAKRTSLPDHLLIFRTKVILNRLPTRQERNRRKDTHADGSLITADCPHCPGTIESHVHALTQCTATRHLLPKLLYRTNQAIRNTASTLHKRGTSDAAWLQSLLQQQHTHTFTLKQGWKTTLTDKHGRVTPTGHGPDRVGVPRGPRTLHPTLFRNRIRNTNTNAEVVKNAFKAAIGDSVDTHWIRLLTHSLPTQLLLSEVDGHPAFPNAHCIASGPAKQVPEHSYEYCVWDAHTRLLRADEHMTSAIDMHLTYNSSPLLIISKDDHLPGLNTVMTIEPGTIQINTRKFWTGAQKSTHNCTNDGYLYIHMSPQCTQEDVDTVQLITRLRHTKEYQFHKTDYTHNIFDAPLPETPRSFHTCIGDNDNDQASIAIRIGSITATQANDIVKKGTPHRMLTKLASKLEHVCLEESHSIWLHRNETPDIDRIRQDTTHRTRTAHKRTAAVLVDTEDTEHNKTTEWEDTRNRVLGRLDAWKRWGTNDTHKVNTAQIKRYNRRHLRQVTLKRPPLHKHTTATPSKKRRHSNMASPDTTQTTVSSAPLTGLFLTPTAHELMMAQASLEKMPHASAIQSLRLHTYINSAALDEAIILLIRPHLPSHTAALLCSDSFFMTRPDMPRHQKRLKATILAHNTTLIPLNASKHWFIVAIDTTTMTVTFHNSAGTYGQQTWKPPLLRWLRQYTPGPWQVVQGRSPRQPGGTECGTHTLLNMIAYTNNTPQPNTSTIQWSHNMRTHILNRIVHAGYTPHTQDTSDSPNIEILPNPTHAPTIHTQPKTINTQYKGSIRHATRNTKNAGTSSTHTQHTHTHSTQVTHSESQQLRHPSDETSTAKLRQLPETQVSDQHTTHTHILARDCLTTTTTAYWEGDRNDQCEVCDKGGTLTECTRCNIVWHASCLHPIPSFPIRPQDAIVCGQACWLELTDNLRQEGKPPPTAEHNTTRQFLPRTHNTTNKTHSFPLVIPHSRDTSTARDKRGMRRVS